LKGTPVITWANPADVVAGTVLGATQLNAVADVGGVFTYNPPAGTQLITIGNHNLSVDFIPGDSSYNSVSDNATINVFAAPITHITITASPMSLAFDQTSLITVTGYDQYENIVTNDNATMIVLSADGGGSLDDTILTLSLGTAHTNLSKDSVGIVHVTATIEGLSPVSATVEFTESDVSSPFVQEAFPADEAIGVPVNVQPYLFFSEPLSVPTVTSATVQLKKSGGVEVPASVSMDFMEGRQRVKITPTFNLDFNTEYYFVVTDGVTDLVGNPATPSDGEYQFTTVADTTTLRVTGISAVKTFAIADDTYENGWSWLFNVTAPTSETELQMKFADWTSALLTTIPVAGNVRYSSTEASNGLVEIIAANTYGDPLHLTGDSDTSAPGRQIEILVEARVPAGSAGGSYSTSYGIFTSQP